MERKWIPSYLHFHIENGKLKLLKRQTAKLRNAGTLVEERTRQTNAAIVLWSQIDGSQSEVQESLVVGVDALVSGANRFDKQIVGMNVGLPSRPLRFSNNNHE